MRSPIEMMRKPALAVLVVLTTLAASTSQAAIRVLAFSPGQAATQRQAQPTMDKFAQVLASELGWDATEVVAAFEPKLDKGLALLEEPDTAFVMVPLPAYLEFKERLGLDPLLSIVYQQGADDRWSLVAPRGRVDGPGSLSGWTLMGAAGYSPDFVRHIALEGWGELPDDVTIEPTARVFSALRKASKGEKDVAVLIDKEQADAFDDLPFKDGLEIVTSSSDVLGFVFCRVGGKLDDSRVDALREKLLTLHRAGAAKDVLAEMRISKFEVLDEARLASFVAKFEQPGS